MIISDFNGFMKKLFSDSVVCLTVAFIILISFTLSYFRYVAHFIFAISAVY